MKKIILIVLMFAAPAIAQRNDWNVKKIFDSENFATTTEDSSAWIEIGKTKYYSIFWTISTDSTNWLKALGGDSLDMDFEYEVHHGDLRPTSSTAGFKLASDGARGHVYAFTSVDTSKTSLYQSLHTNTDPISPSAWVRFFLDKSAKAKALSVGIKITAWLWYQK